MERTFLIYFQLFIFSKREDKTSARRDEEIIFSKFERTNNNGAI